VRINIKNINALKFPFGLIYCLYPQAFCKATIP
jgi:hypothetical protein